MRIFHLATAADWAAAQASGSYTTSTRGRTLAEEGFLHASTGEQWQGVRERYYADVTEPLVLLVIDTERLAAPVVVEDTFPHIYGALEPAAVVQVIPLDGRPVSGDSFSRIFLAEMFHHLVLASIVMAAVVMGAVVGRQLESQWGALIGTLVGLALGVPIAIGLNRRRQRLASRPN